MRIAAEAKDHLISLGLALAGGLALRFGFGLQPVWWLAWLAPAPVLVAALRSTPRVAFLFTMLRTGDLFGWLCTAGALVLVCLKPLWLHAGRPMPAWQQRDIQENIVDK
jgi:hypothetical protein